MFKAVKKFIFGEEKPSMNDILFNLLYFTDVEAEQLSKSVRTKEDFINKVLIPFNFMIIPILLGARCIKGKNGWNLLFNQYSLSDKESKQVLFLIEKFYQFSETFYDSLGSDDTDNIENIPDREISLKKVKISEIPEVLFGVNGNDGIISQRIAPDVAEKLIAEGKEIGAAIKKKALCIEAGIGAAIIAAIAGGGYYLYNHNKSDETSDSTEVITDDTENEDITNVEPVEDVVIVSTDEM